MPFIDTEAFTFVYGNTIAGERGLDPITALLYASGAPKMESVGGPAAIRERVEEHA